jgi:hypothetical protein
VTATPDINQTLRVYLGDEDGGYQPIGDPDARLRSAFPEDYESRRAMIDKYLAEDSTVEWSATSLVAAGDLFAEALRRKFPELDSTSARGLANRFTYTWR